MSADYSYLPTLFGAGTGSSSSLLGTLYGYSTQTSPAGGNRSPR